MVRLDKVRNRLLRRTNKLMSLHHHHIPIRLWILALAIQAIILREIVDKLPLRALHRLERKPLLGRTLRKRAQRLLDHGGERSGLFIVELDRLVAIAEIERVTVRIYLERKCESARAAGVVAFDFLGLREFGFGRIAFDVLFYPSAGARDCDLCRARRGFAALERRMARIGIGVSARSGFPAGLSAGLVALAVAVTDLLACVRTAGEFLPADSPAGNGRQKARLVFDLLLAADAFLDGEVGTLGAGLGVAVAAVRDGGVIAALFPHALMGTLRRSSSAGNGGLNDSPAAVAGKLFKASFQTAAAGSTVAEHGAVVLAAFEELAAGSGADVFRLETLVAA